MAKKTEKKRPVTKYVKFQRAAKANCRIDSPASRERLKKAEKAYKEKAKADGKSSSEINKTVARVKRCPAKKK